MMRKMLIGGVVLAAAISLCGASTVSASAERVETKGIAFEIPEELKDLVTVKTDGLEEDELVSVYETASVDAAAALGENNDGAGWIFSISTVPEARLKELRCGMMDGMEVFAEDDGTYYMYNHPTDVRVVRENNEEMNQGLEQWTSINQWADQEVRQEILANNQELDTEFYTNTYLDILLAKAAYEPGTKFELRSLEFGPDPLDPKTLAEDDFIKDLAEDFTYEELSDAQAPDGEYYVLAFKLDDEEEIRYDFFRDPDSMNLIREVRMVGDEESVTYYQANPKDSGDADETTTGIVEAWCRAIANGGELDD